MKKKRPVILIIASSDSGGGAGIQADCRTASTLGCYSTMAIVSLTAQNTKGVQAIYPIPCQFVLKQLNSIFSDIECDAIKIGMLYSAEIIEAVATFLAQHKQTNTHLIIDPVFIATSGDRLIKKQAVALLEEKLLPLATLITPNHLEGEVLGNAKIKSLAKMEEVAKNLCRKYQTSVLLKGGDFSLINEASDVFIPYQNHWKQSTSDTHKASCLPQWYSHKKIATNALHGTGCTLSTAIACYLSMGFPLPTSIKKAKQFITSAIQSSRTQNIGKGVNQPVDSLFSKK